MTLEQANQILLTLKAALPHADANLDPLQAKARDEVYRKILLGWNAGPTQDAVQACLLSSRYYPSLAELAAQYAASNRSRPELVRAPRALPAAPVPASFWAEIREKLAHMFARSPAITHSAPNDAESQSGGSGASVPAIGVEVAPAEVERAMIEQTIARARARKGVVS